MSHIQALGRDFKGTHRETRLRSAPVAMLRDVRDYANKFFAGRIKGRIRVFLALDWAFDGDRSLWGCCMLMSDGSYCIVVHKRLLKLQRLLAWTLLHELSHIPTMKGDDDHGPAFKREMRRLVRWGAFDEIL